ncbi:MAG: hypothetical protein ABIA04_16410 [Pseudomonadota bacterium]
MKKGFLFSSQKPIIIYLLCLILFFEITINAQDSDNFTSIISIYIDDSTGAVDEEFIKEKISLVNYAIDRKDSHVHVIVTSLSTGSGTEYVLEFYGKKKFKNIDDRITFNIYSNDSDDQIRKSLVYNLKLGLFPYLIRTTYLKDLSLTYKKQNLLDLSNDPWDKWVFTLGLQGSFNGEESTNTLNMKSTFDVDRVTEDWRFDLSSNYTYNKSSYEISSTETIDSILDEKTLNLTIVKSLGQHWGLGVNGRVQASSYSNLDFSSKLAPAIEYNIFPYSEANRRIFRIHYWPGFYYQNYTEETIYDKWSEFLFGHYLLCAYSMKEQWGQIDFSTSGFHYFHDYEKYYVNIANTYSVNLFKGLSLDLYGYLAMIHDQLTLPKGGASQEEILLQQVEIETSYTYTISLGLSYKFGSKFSNIINPRFGYY